MIQEILNLISWSILWVYLFGFVIYTILGGVYIWIEKLPFNLHTVLSYLMNTFLWPISLYKGLTEDEK